MLHLCIIIFRNRGLTITKRPQFENYCTNLIKLLLIFKKVW